MTNTPHNIDETTNHDLPGEIEDLHDGNCEVMVIDDPYNQSFPCGHYQERWWNWNPAIIGPDAEEPVYDEDDAPDFDEESMGADGDFYDCEDDSWSDSDSLASCGWGEDAAYGCWE